MELSDITTNEEEVKRTVSCSSRSRHYTKHMTRHQRRRYEVSRSREHQQSARALLIEGPVYSPNISTSSEPFEDSEAWHAEEIELSRNSLRTTPGSSILIIFSDDEDEDEETFSRDFNENLQTRKPSIVTPKGILLGRTRRSRVPKHVTFDDNIDVLIYSVDFPFAGKVLKRNISAW